MDPQLVAIALGSIVGVILALSGAGGGIIAVPLLVFGLNLSIQQASPVGLLAVAIAASAGALLGLRRGMLRGRAAALMGLAAAFAAPLGVDLAHHIPNVPLILAFAVLLGWTGRRMWRRSSAKPDPSIHSKVVRPCGLNTLIGRLDWRAPCARSLALTGLVSGVVTGMLGVGGGFIIVPSLTRNTDLSQFSIVATSLGVIALASTGGFAAAAATGNIMWPIAIPFGFGALSGLLGGLRIASRLEGTRLQQSFALVCLATSLLMGMRGLGFLQM